MSEAPSCKHCLWWYNRKFVARRETFVFLTSEWDVDAAKAIIRKSPRAPRPLSDDSPRSVNHLITIDEDHVDHVDPKLPGITVTTGNGLLFIDGHHRAARALKDGVPFETFILDLEESKSVCLSGARVVFAKPKKVRQPRKPRRKYGE